jgi:hypothetical protein
MITRGGPIFAGLLGAPARRTHRMKAPAAPRSARVKLTVASVTQLSAEQLLGLVGCDN